MISKPAFSKETDVIATKRNFVINYIKKQKKRFSERQFRVLCLFSITHLFVGALGSLAGPFFPEVVSFVSIYSLIHIFYAAGATAKGASATEYGMVFGIYEIAAMTASPFFGTNIKSLGVKNTYSIGLLTTGVSCMIFGLLNQIQDSISKFIGICLAVRTLEGIGDAAYLTASFTIIAMEFTDDVAITFSIIETFYGLGLIIGPSLGGYLYELGGYSFPFLLIGGSLLVFAFIAYAVIPTEVSHIIDSTKKNNGTNGLKTENPRFLDLIKIPAVAITSYSVVVAAVGEGFLCTLLEPHLRQFKLGKVAVGSVFLLCGAVYAITAPFWGYICDRIENPKLLTLLGSIFSILGFVLIGPLPFLPFDTILWVTCIGQMLFGLGMGAIYVSAFLIFLNDAFGRGFPDDLSTYGLVSGLWKTMLSLGFIIGPTIGGILQDHVGFRWGSLFVIGTQLLL